MSMPRSWKPIATATGAAAWILAYRGVPNAFDEWLALPIALESARPGTYPAGDLLVQGSMVGPFHLYKAAGVLYSLGLNVDLVWYVLLALSLIAFFLVVWRLGRAIGLTEVERVAMVMAIAASPEYRGTLNWSAQPMLSFITASVAVPLGVFALAAAFEGRVVVALIAAAVAFDVHPALGICAGIGVFTILLSTHRWRTVLSGAAAAAIVALPNAIYLIGHTSLRSTKSDQSLLTIFQSFGWHTFVRDHWKEGYPWYVLGVALAFAGSEKLSAPTGRALRITIAVLTGIAMLWMAVMNLAPLTAILPLYLVRASLLVKPLMIGLAVVAITRRNSSGTVAWLVPLAAVLAIVSSNTIFAEAAVAAALGVVLLDSPRWPRRLAAGAAWCCAIALFAVAAAGEIPAIAAIAQLSDAVRIATIAVGLAIGAMLISWPSDSDTVQAAGGSRQRAILVIALALPVLGIVLARPPGRSWFPESLWVIKRRAQLSEPLPREAGAMLWARNHSPAGSLFAVPPVEMEWVRFRVVARRGVFANVADVDQLIYVREYVFPEIDRLSALGVVIRAPHDFDDAAYNHPTCDQLQRLAVQGLTHYVLPDSGSFPPEVAPLYRDQFYTILDVPRTAAACR